MQTLDRKTSKYELMYWLSLSELNICARKKAFKSKFDSRMEYLNIEDRGPYLMGRERNSH
jgi:hypothetical protein